MIFMMIKATFDFDFLKDVNSIQFIGYKIKLSQKNHFTVLKRGVGLIESEHNVDIHFSLDLKTSSEGDPTTKAGNLFHGSTIRTGKAAFLQFNRNRL